MRPQYHAHTSSVEQLTFRNRSNVPHQRQKQFTTPAQRASAHLCNVCDFASEVSPWNATLLPVNLLGPFSVVAVTLTSLTFDDCAIPDELFTTLLGRWSPLRRTLESLTVVDGCLFVGAMEWVLDAPRYLPWYQTRDLYAPRWNPSYPSDELVSIDSYLDSSLEYSTFRQSRPVWIEWVTGREHKINYICQTSKLAGNHSQERPFSKLRHLKLSLRMVDADELKLIMWTGLFPALKELEVLPDGENCVQLCADEVTGIRRAVSGFVLIGPFVVRARITNSLFLSPPNISDPVKRVFLTDNGEISPNSARPPTDYEEEFEWTYLSTTELKAMEESERPWRGPELTRLDLSALCLHVQP